LKTGNEMLLCAHGTYIAASNPERLFFAYLTSAAENKQVVEKQSN
jgi:hypothetical protein